MRSEKMEIRIYFESLEQAFHYIFPIVRQTLQSLKKDIEIKLVKLAKNYNSYGKRIAPIIFWKEPDILLSIVEEEEEYPLLLVEFSSAVFTEDHELQRFDGLVAAAKNNCIYAKISPTTKRSPYAHGGNVEFDYGGPFSLIYKKFGKLFFHFEWECDDKGVVKVNTDYVSCPPRIEEFELLIQTIVTEIIKNRYSNEWIAKVLKTLSRHSHFAEWFNKIEKTPSIDVTCLNTSRTKWIKKDSSIGCGALELKLNRFGHAMDPERGMLAYYGTMVDKVISKMIFDEDNDAWYKDIPKETEIKRYIRQKGLTTPYDFLYCFALGSGLHENSEFINIVKNFVKAPSEPIEVDLTEFIKNNFFQLSKPLKTIFGYSSLFVLEDTVGERKVIFKWKPYDEPKFFENYKSITSIGVRTTLDEDDVTYITIHSILRPNGYRIIAASYPGAQADRVILVEPRTGRRQKRKYIDIICYLPEKATNLQENKGAYQPTVVQKDVTELSKYKTEKAYKDGLKDFLERYAVEASKLAVKIGVGFWANRNFTVSDIKDLNLKDLDYFVYITSDRKNWNVWRTGKDNMFSITNGKVHIPKTYEVAFSGETNVNLSSFF
jgi:hypothetical protein